MRYKDRQRLSNLVAYTANCLGVTDICRWLTIHLQQPNVRILFYHRVGDSKLPWNLQQVSTTDFEIEMKYLHRKYEVIALQKVVQCLQEKQPLPRNAVVITFDDGYKDNYLHAYPILKKYNLSATIFLATGHLDSGELFWWDKVRYAVWYSPLKTIKLDELGIYHLHSAAGRLETITKIEARLKKMPEEKKDQLIEKLISVFATEIPPDLGREVILSWDEVREMRDNGIDFGAHTVNHPILTRIPSDTAKWEITESKKRIKEEIGQPVVTFSYPNGGPTDFNNEIKKNVKDAGFACAVINASPRLVAPGSDLYQLGRIGTASNPNMLKFSLELFPEILTVLRR